MDIAVKEYAILFDLAAEQLHEHFVEAVVSEAEHCRAFRWLLFMLLTAGLLGGVRATVPLDQLPALVPVDLLGDLPQVADLAVVRVDDLRGLLGPLRRDQVDPLVVDLTVLGDLQLPESLVAVADHAVLERAVLCAVVPVANLLELHGVAFRLVGYLLTRIYQPGQKMSTPADVI